MNKEFEKIAKELVLLYEEAYCLYEPQVKMIIKNKIKDINFIEHMLDNVMDIYTEKGFYLFIELLMYYSTVNYQKAKDYLKILKEQREEEYIDFIKKYQKDLKK